MEVVSSPETWTLCSNHFKTLVIVVGDIMIINDMEVEKMWVEDGKKSKWVWIQILMKTLNQMIF